MTGTIESSEGGEFGVTVNGMVAMVYGNEFVMNHAPLGNYPHVITAVAYDVDGNSTETSIMVNLEEDEKFVTLTAGEYGGVSPFEVKQTIDATFDMAGSQLFSLN